MDPDEPYYSRTSRKICNPHTLPTFGTIGACRQLYPDSLVRPHRLVGLGHSAFNAATQVGIPLGTPIPIPISRDPRLGGLRVSVVMSAAFPLQICISDAGFSATAAP